MDATLQDHQPIEKQMQNKFPQILQPITQTRDQANLLTERLFDNKIKNNYQKNKKIKLGNMLKQLSKLDYSELPIELAQHLDVFIELSKQIKIIEIDIIRSLNHKHNIFQSTYDFDSDPELEVQKNRKKKWKPKTLSEVVQTNQLLGENQKKIFLNLQKKMKIMETKVLKYLHDREYFPMSDKHTCDICKATFDTGKQLGGHMSRSHPGKSEQYLIKKEVHDNKRQDRERRKYFQQNQKQLNNSMEVSKKLPTSQKSKLKLKKIKSQIKLQETVKIQYEIPVKIQDEDYQPEIELLSQHHQKNQNQNYQHHLRKRIKIFRDKIQPYEIHDQISPEQIPFYNQYQQENIYLNSLIRPAFNDHIMKASPGKTIRF